MIKAVIFDLDGTLGDTAESIAYSANHALAEIGCPTFPVEQFRYFVGDGVDMLIRRCLMAAGDEQCVQFDVLKTAYQTCFSENCMYHVKPYEGICEMLTALKKRGIRIAVFSNKPHTQAVQVVEKLFGAGYFDMILGQTAQFGRKPAPDGALAIAERLAVTPQECLYVGDTNTDMQTGNAAQMTPVGVLWGFRDRKELEANNSAYIIEKPAELLSVLNAEQAVPRFKREDH